MKALREVEQLKNAIMQAHIDGEISEDSLAILEHNAPRERLTSGDLVEWLEGTTLARRRALLFALETGMDTREVIELTWKDLRGLQMTQFARDLAQAMARHIRLPYVFWDTMPNGVAAPLFGLRETALEVSQGLGFAVLCRLYADMLMIDARTDAEFFEKDIGIKFG